MVSRSFPGYPSFAHGLRLATPADLSRLADLSVLGFKDSEIFRYERPEYNKFPFDAVTSFYNIYRAQLVNPRAVVIVAEDNQRSDEAIHLSSQSKDRLDDSNAHSERVVVGVGIWILPPGSIREGQFVPPCVGDPLPAPNRDLCLRRLERFVHIAETTEEKYFKGKLVFNKLVVHPSYSRRGHAKAILRWGQRLADQDAVDQGVIPAQMAEQFYLSLNYEIIGEMHIPDDDEVEGFTQKVAVYKAQGPEHSV